jgi:heme exporter protein C
MPGGSGTHPPETAMQKLFVPIAALTALMFAYSPIAIANAPYESTMLLVQKVFYYHFATWMAVTLAVTIAGVGSAVFLFKGSAAADRWAFAAAELTVIFCAFGLVSGSLWGRKAWGVWWQWDARLTMALLLELIFIGYLLVRQFGGPGSEKLAAGMGIFGAATAPFVYYAVDIWRTVHPQRSVVPTLVPEMWNVVWFCVAAFVLLAVLLLLARVRLEELRAEMDRLYLAAED